MTTAESNTPPEGNTPPEPPAQETPPPADPPKKEIDWVAESRKWEQRAKENKAIADQNTAAAKKLQELEDAQKTELEKIQQRAEAAERRAQELEDSIKKREAEAELAKQIADWKAAVAQETGVPATVLRGSTEDEIKAHAESLKEAFPAPDPRRGAYVPGEGRSTGSGTTDPRALFAEILKRT